MTFPPALLVHAPALAIAIPLIAAFVVPLIGRGERTKNLFTVVSLSVTVFLTMILTIDALSGNVSAYSVGAVSPGQTAVSGMPVRIILVADAVSALVSFVAVSISLLAAIYSWKFMEGYKGLGKFYALLLLLTAGIVGMSLTGDFFTLFVFLEITSISSAGLIAFWRKGESFEAAFKFMVISAIGALFLLFGIGLLYGKYGMLNMASLSIMISTNYGFIDAVALSLIASALLMKAGSVPVHMWKPDVFQEAPPQVVIMLVSSAMVFLYVLFRICFTVFHFALNPTLATIMIAFGILSIFFGVMMAMPQRNLKRLFGYATIAEIGYVLLGAGAGLLSMPMMDGFSFKALAGGLFHMVNGAIILSLLFLAAYTALYITKKKEFDEIGGLAHSSPALAILFLIGLLAVAGMPPFNGFASKLMIYESVYIINPVLSIIGILGSVMLLAVFVKVFAALFLGVPYKEKVRKVPMSMMIVMFILAFLIVFLGLFPGLAYENIIRPATEALAYPSSYLLEVTYGKFPPGVIYG
jgi:multicomponent Na+:H+ antiporter subunit D